MTPVLHSLPDMRLETIGLLYVSPNITRLLAMFAGLFFSKSNAGDMAHLAVYKRYIAAFRKSSSIPVDWPFFAKMPLQEYLMCALCLLFENEAFYAQAHSDSEWLALLRRAYIYMNDTGSALDMLQDMPTLADEARVVQSDAVQFRIFVLFALVPGVFYLLSAVPLIFYDLVGEKLERMRRELNVRRGETE